MSDYSPPYTDEDARNDARKARVIARVKKLTIADFTFAELLQIIEVFRGTSYEHLISMHDVARLEKFLKRRSGFNK